MTTAQRPAPATLAVDSSALLAVLLAEPAAAAVIEHLARNEAAVVCAASVMECSMVAQARFGESGVVALDDLCQQAGLVVVPLDDTILAAARVAYDRFGKGRHPAALNFGDCFAYAVAHHYEVPLLCIGDDFRRTDLVVVP